MSTRAMARTSGMFPSMFDDFFKPWSEWFENGNQPRRQLTVPAVNISEDEGSYKISVAAPGLQKEDFKIDTDDKMLTITAEKEENKTEKEGRFNRQEYNYTSFSRSFSLPDDVKAESIEAYYQNGELQLMLPKKEMAPNAMAPKKIQVQ